MGDQIIDDLAKAFRNVTVSRKRALQTIGGAMAVAVSTRLPQSAEARKRRKPPLAFVVATVTVNAASPAEFTLQISGAVAHPTSNYATTFLMNRGFASNLTTDKLRAEIVAALKTNAATLLKIEGDTVAADRIAVTLL